MISILVGSLKSKNDIVNHVIGYHVLVVMNRFCRGMLFRRFRIPLLVFLRLHRLDSDDFTTAHNTRFAGDDGLLILVGFFENWNELIGLLIGGCASHSESGKGLSLDHFC